MRADYIPGWLFLTAVALVCSELSELVEIGGKHPLEASALGVLIGVLALALWRLPKVFEAGVKSSEKLLVLGIVLLGVSLDLPRLFSESAGMLAVIVCTMFFGFLCILALARLFKIPPVLGVLLAVGTTICGGTAVALTAPLVDAPEEDISYAVGTVALWGLLAIFLYPWLGRVVGASDFNFGVFAGTAIHSTPQVVGAAYIFSGAAGLTATAVKLIRNCFMAPVALGIALWHSRSVPSGQKLKSFTKAFPWFLFGYFVMSALSSKGYFTTKGVDNIAAAGKFLILIGMCGVGFNTSIRSLRAMGSRPLMVGLLGSLLVAAFSIGSIYVFLG